MTRRLFTAALCALLLIGGGLVVHRMLFVPSATTDVSATVPAPTPETPQRIAVKQVEGTVERLGADAAWTAVRAGDALALEESIRTGESGRAVLDVGEATEVSIEPQSQFSVRDISRTAARVRLDGGRMSATIRDDAESTLRIENQGSDAVAESSGGELSVLNTGDGRVILATRRGRARLSAGNAAVEVGPGEQSVANRGAAPAAPSAIPPSLFLKVVGLEKRMQREKTSTIRGSASPGAVISVNGVRAVSEGDGTFTAVVELQEGRNGIVVRADDVLGRHERFDAGNVTVKSKMAPVESKADWGKNSKAKGNVVW